jgi:hypothetical protein
MGFLQDCLHRPASWHFCTSEGTSVNLGEIVLVGMADLDFYVTQTPATASVTSVGPLRSVSNATRLRFFGLGRGIGVGSPIDISRSATNMPSGGRIYCGPMTKGSDVSLSDMKGQCTIEVGAIAAFAGASGMMIWFGTPGPPAFARGLGLLWGTGIETPGVGAMEYTGYIW